MFFIFLFGQLKKKQYLCSPFRPLREVSRKSAEKVQKKRILIINDLQTFFKKNAKEFGHVKKKQYLCTRFRAENDSAYENTQWFRIEIRLKKCSLKDWKQ